MSGSDGRPMLENAARMDVEKIMKDPVAASPEEQPIGTVKRVLNFRDRNLLIGACRQWADKDGKGDHKGQSKVDRLTKAISFQETIDYFNMIDDSVEDALFRWQKDRNSYLSFKQYEAGGLTLEDLRKRAPWVDVSSPPAKPPKAQPEASPEEMRGKERTFYLPSKLDAWVQDVLKVSTFPSIASEYVVELCKKFGINEEE
jgi:hypothetical protein